MRGPRRWDLSADELDRIVAARTGGLGARAALSALARNPRLVPEVARIVGDSLRTGVFGNNSLTSLLSAERARAVVPDAATGAGWYDERPFLDALAPWCATTAIALELGCGAGRISRHVAPLVGELVCTDASPAMLAEARENLRSFANVRVAKTDGYALGEFAPESFDLAFGQGVLGYLAPNQLLGLLDEVGRVLRPGGVSVFNFLTIDDPRDAGDQLAAVREQARKRRPHGGIDQSYTGAQLEAIHAVAGLRVAHPDPESSGESRRGRITIVGRREAAL